MADLETFRRETRAWLEKKEDRVRARAVDRRPLLGRPEGPVRPGRQAVARRHGEPRLDGADVAEGVRRRRPRQATRRASCRRRWRASACVRR